MKKEDNKIQSCLSKKNKDNVNTQLVLLGSLLGLLPLVLLVILLLPSFLVPPLPDLVDFGDGGTEDDAAAKGASISWREGDLLLDLAGDCLALFELRFSTLGDPLADLGARIGLFPDVVVLVAVVRLLLLDLFLLKKRLSLGVLAGFGVSTTTTAAAGGVGATGFSVISWAPQSGAPLPGNRSLGTKRTNQSIKRNNSEGSKRGKSTTKGGCPHAGPSAGRKLRPDAVETRACCSADYGG